SRKGSRSENQSYPRCGLFVLRPEPAVHSLGVGSVHRTHDVFQKIDRAGETRDGSLDDDVPFVPGQSEAPRVSLRHALSADEVVLPQDVGPRGAGRWAAEYPVLMEPHRGLSIKGAFV